MDWCRAKGPLKDKGMENIGGSDGLRRAQGNSDGEAACSLLCTKETLPKPYESSIKFSNFSIN